MHKILLAPIEFERHELAKYRQWAEDQIKFIIDQAPLHTDCKVDKITYNPGIFGQLVIVEMKVKEKGEE